MYSNYLALAFFFLFWGMPILIILWMIFRRWDSQPKSIWQGFVALGLWIIQGFVVYITTTGCLSGHCSGWWLADYGVYVVSGLSYIGIIWLIFKATFTGIEFNSIDKDD